MKLAIDQDSELVQPPVVPHQFPQLAPQRQWYQQHLYQPQHDYRDTPVCDLYKK